MWLPFDSCIRTSNFVLRCHGIVTTSGRILDFSVQDWTISAHKRTKEWQFRIENAIRTPPSDEMRSLVAQFRNLRKMTSMLNLFAPNVWTVEGPIVSFYGFPYPTRMVAIQLSDGTAWIWSPVELTEDLALEVVRTVGPVKHIVSPNKIHWLFMKPWQERFPQAKMYASPGLANRKIASNLEFSETLTNEAPVAYAKDIDQVLFQGGAMDEVWFFHKASKTAIVCDLIQRHKEEDQTGWKGWLMRVDGMVGPLGSTPKEWRMAFWMCGLLPKARSSLDKVTLEWKPEKLVIAHGENAEEGATFVIENCLPWIPKDPEKSCQCCSR